MARPKGKRRLGQRERHQLALASRSASDEPLVLNRPTIRQIQELGLHWGEAVGHEVEAVAGPPQEHQIVIESLDEGATWHTTDTIEPAVNQNGRLVIGTAPCGAAPDCMRPGSGTYRFTITSRRATEEETRVWVEQWVERERERIACRDTELADWKNHMASRRKVRARALELLLSHLTPRQREDFVALGGFWVVSQFQNLYWVSTTTAIRFEREVAVQGYCIYAFSDIGNIPPEDNALTRMILLKSDEERFLQTANAFTPHEGNFMRARVQDPELMTPAQIEILRRNNLDQLTNMRAPFMPYCININGFVRALCG